jgi:hypothetical protein
MRFKSGIAVTHHTGRLIGFCSVDDGVLGFDNLCNSEPELATHVIVFMARGMMCGANVPFIWYPFKSLTAMQLYKVVWKATRILKDLGLKVRAWVCDGAAYRKLYNNHEGLGLDFDGLRHLIYFICDVPHLLKTVRNNLETPVVIKGQRIFFCQENP